MKLVQQSPYETEVRAVLAGDRLYFGFLCRDPEPHRIAIHTMRRDGLMQGDEGVTRGDDTVSIAIDPYDDKRTGYFFAINAAGARSDGLIADPERVHIAITIVSKKIHIGPAHSRTYLHNLFISHDLASASETDKKIFNGLIPILRYAIMPPSSEDWL